MQMVFGHDDVCSIEVASPRVEKKPPAYLGHFLWFWPEHLPLSNGQREYPVEHRSACFLVCSTRPCSGNGNNLPRGRWSCPSPARIRSTATPQLPQGLMRPAAYPK